MAMIRETVVDKTKLSFLNILFDWVYRITSSNLYIIKKRVLLRVVSSTSATNQTQYGSHSMLHSQNLLANKEVGTYIATEYSSSLSYGKIFTSETRSC